jgi:hypothetical protein
MNSIRALRYAMLLSFMIFGLGCSTITFVQVEQAESKNTETRWHHATLNGMVELSKPLDIQSICGDKAWTEITTEHTFYNWLAEVLVPGIEFLLFYSAWTNEVACHEAPQL